MAPEQWRGAPEDERTDVFAFGIILYRMLSGELPFADGGKALESARPAPELEVPDAPALGALVARMLDKDPVKRPRHGGELVAELEAVAPAGTGGSTSAFTTGGMVRRRPSSWPRLLALALAAAVLGGVVAALVVQRPGARAESMPSVAVLPFASLSAGKDDEAFAAGIHGELLTQLAKMSGLRVIARSSVEQFRAEPRDLKVIAADLGVATILEGRLQRAGDRVRIFVQLVDPRRGQEIWAERYDRDVADVFAIQTEVALEIARALGAKLTVSEKRLVERPPTWDSEAHDLYRRGVYYWQRSVGVESDNEMADQLLEKAVARDGSFALAHAWLAMVQAEWKHDCAGARRHAGRALALEPDLPQAHAARGHLHYFCERGQVAAAIREYEEAVRGAPGDALARVFLGGLRTSAGQLEEGLADLRVGLALDPRSFLVSVEVAREMSRARHFDLAERVCERARELNPGDVHALALCALIPFWRSGDLAPGRRALEVLPHELPNGGDGAWSLSALLALFPEQALEFVAAGRVQEPVAKSPLIPRDYVAGVAYSSLGQAQKARAAFAQALPALEGRVREAPEDPLARLFLGRAYAGVGRDEEAMEESGRAIGLAPQEGLRSSWLRFRAEIAAAAGRADEAVEALADALRRPDGTITAASVKADPRYAVLRGDPRFEALVKEPAR
jgi:TolB-like protein/Tfp pilus assembly protein PilF